MQVTIRMAVMLPTTVRITYNLTKKQVAEIRSGELFEGEPSIVERVMVQPSLSPRTLYEQMTEEDFDEVDRLVRAGLGVE